VPAEIKHPLLVPLVYASRYPVPENPVPGVVVPVDDDPEVVVESVVPAVVVVVAVEPVLGRYFTPEVGQVDLDPSGDVATNVPSWTEPRTSYEYQSSVRAPLVQPRVTS